jgi:hypothetical protein
MNNCNSNRKATKHFTNFDRGCLEGKIKDKQIIERRYAMTDSG